MLPPRRSSEFWGTSRIRIFITGDQGYVGSVLAPYLLAQGHEVMGIDSGFHAHALLYQDRRLPPPSTAKDIRQLETQDLIGFDAVIHLAGLSNDPLGELMPLLTRDINFSGTLRTAIAARDAGVARFINFSSCAVYGGNCDEAKTELCATKPLTEYARCKLLSEAAIIQLASDSFTVVSMRNATVFGPSPRMRFDLVLNNLAAQAWTSNELELESDGTPWRPLIHIRDLARATAVLLEAPSKLVNRQVFNVGDDCLNHQVHKIATAVSRAFGGCNLRIGSNDCDGRSYRVSFRKFRETFGFACEQDLEMGAEELRQLFSLIKLTQADFESPLFNRLRRIKTLLLLQKVDTNLFWLDQPSNTVETACAIGV